MPVNHTSLEQIQERINDLRSRSRGLLPTPAQMDLTDASVLDRIAQNDPTIIHLKGYRIDTRIAVALARALKANNTMTSLDLAYNEIDDDGAVALADALKKSNNTLRSINLRGNLIGDRGAMALADALIVNSTVTFFDIGSEQIQIDRDIMELINSLIERNKIMAQLSTADESDDELTQSIIRYTDVNASLSVVSTVSSVTTTTNVTYLAKRDNAIEESLEKAKEALKPKPLQAAEAPIALSSSAAAAAASSPQCSSSLFSPTNIAPESRDNVVKTQSGLDVEQLELYGPSFP